MSAWVSKSLKEIEKMKILVWKNKYGTRYFNASSPEARESASLQILQELLDMGFISAPVKDDDYSNGFMELVNMDEKDVESLPETFKKEALRARDSYASQLREYNDEVKFFATVTNLLSGVPQEFVSARRRDQNDEQWSRVFEVISARQAGARLAIDEKTGGEVIMSVKTAWSVLNNRSGEGEYESYEIEDVETVADNFVNLARKNLNV